MSVKYFLQEQESVAKNGAPGNPSFYSTLGMDSS